MCALDDPRRGDPPPPPTDREPMSESDTEVEEVNGDSSIPMSFSWTVDHHSLIEENTSPLCDGSGSGGSIVDIDLSGHALVDSGHAPVDSGHAPVNPRG